MNTGVYDSAIVDVSSLLSSSHKRVGDNSSVIFGIEPEAKRFYLENCMDLSTLKINEHEWVPQDLTSLELFGQENEISKTELDRESSLLNVINWNDPTLVHNYDKSKTINQYENRETDNQTTACNNRLGSKIEINDYNDSSINQNIANTSAYVGSLLDIMESSHEMGSVKSPNKIEYDSGCLKSLAGDNITKNEELEKIQFFNKSSFCKPDDILPKDEQLLSLKKTISNENNSQILLENVSDKYIIENVFHKEDADDDDGSSLLRNLPTSVDDFQAKEFHLKLERNVSSPHGLASATLLSPPLNSAASSNVFDEASKQQLVSAFSFSDDTLTCPASTSATGCFMSKAKSKLNSASGYMASSATVCNSRTISNASENLSADDEYYEFDENDREVAMINESFEEEQKNKRIYHRPDIQKAFYSGNINPDTKIKEKKKLKLVSAQRLFSISPFESSKLSAPHKKITLYEIKKNNTDRKQLSEEEDNFVDASIDFDSDDITSTEEDHSTDITNVYNDNISDDQQNEKDANRITLEKYNIRVKTPQSHSKEYFFTPVLTPKSLQFVLQQGKSFQRQGKYQIPTGDTKSANNNTNFPNGYPLLNPQLFKRNDNCSQSFSSMSSCLNPQLSNMILSKNDINVIKDDNHSLLTTDDAYIKPNESVLKMIWAHDLPNSSEKSYNRLNTDNYDIAYSTPFESQICQMKKEEINYSNNSKNNIILNESQKTEELPDFSTDDLVAQSVAFNVVRKLFDSPLLFNDYREVSQTEKNDYAELADEKKCSLFLTECDTISRPKGNHKNHEKNRQFQFKSELNFSPSVKMQNNAAFVEEEDRSVELSPSDLADSTLDLCDARDIQHKIADNMAIKEANDFDQAKKFKNLNLNNTNNTIDIFNNNNNNVSVNNSDNNNNMDMNINNTSIYNLNTNVGTTSNLIISSSTSSSTSSFSFLDSKSSKTESAGDEQAVPVIDSWENIDDNEELTARMVNQAKSTLAKANALKNASALFETSNEVCRNESTIQHEFNELAHVIEASYIGGSKTDEEITHAINIIKGKNEFVWHKKVDPKHYLVIFPSATQASEALFEKQTETFLTIKMLDNASEITQCYALSQRIKLSPKKRRPSTTMTVARRMIANALQRQINVPTEQREREARQLSEAKEIKRRQKAIWEN